MPHYQLSSVRLYSRIAGIVDTANVIFKMSNQLLEEALHTCSFQGFREISPR